MTSRLDRMASLAEASGDATFAAQLRACGVRERSPHDRVVIDLRIPENADEMLHLISEAPVVTEADGSRWLDVDWLVARLTVVHGIVTKPSA